MELDNIKKKWQNAEIKLDIDNEKIGKMLSNDGHSAYNALLKFEKIGAFAMVICSVFGYFVFSRYLPVSIVYTVSAFFAFFWQIYKIRKLRQINIGHMTIMEISSKLYSYRKIIFKEFFAGAAWLVLFFIFLGYYELLETPLSVGKLIALTISVLVVMIVVFVLYKVMYWNNIKKLASAIEEIEEFERDNQE